MPTDVVGRQAAPPATRPAPTVPSPTVLHDVGFDLTKVAIPTFMAGDQRHVTSRGRALSVPSTPPRPAEPVSVASQRAADWCSCTVTAVRKIAGLPKPWFDDPVWYAAMRSPWMWPSPEHRGGRDLAYRVTVATCPPADPPPGSLVFGLLPSSWLNALKQWVPNDADRGAAIGVARVRRDDADPREIALTATAVADGLQEAGPGRSLPSASDLRAAIVTARLLAG